GFGGADQGVAGVLGEGGQRILPVILVVGDVVLGAVVRDGGLVLQVGAGDLGLLGPLGGGALELFGTLLGLRLGRQRLLHLLVHLLAGVLGAPGQTRAAGGVGGGQEQAAEQR